MTSKKKRARMTAYSHEKWAEYQTGVKFMERGDIHETKEL